MKIIVTGAKGQLGYDVVKMLTCRGYNDVIGIDFDDLDITDAEKTSQFFKFNNPDVIIHCAAFTSVDKAEESKEICMNVNVSGTRHLVEQAQIYDAKFVYISTDYVFDGEKVTPYEIFDKPNPKSVYGVSKYLGEIETSRYEKHFIIRISWVFGKNGLNFVKTMLKLGKEKEFLSVVNDQLGSPTYTYDLSVLIVDMIETNKYGVYHATNEGTCSWYDFAKEIFSQAKIKILVNPITSNDYPTKATRPKNSIMSKSSLDYSGFNRLPKWESALLRYLIEIEVI